MKPQTVKENCVNAVWQSLTSGKKLQTVEELVEYMKPPAMIAGAVHEMRAGMEDVVASMPHKITTPAQRALAKLHGTPREFARKCIMAIGEISHDEAVTALSKYFKQWEDAK